MDKLILTTKLSVEDFTRVNYHFLYRKIPMKVLRGMGIFFLIITPFYYNDISALIGTLLLGCFFTFAFPLVTYFSSKSAYQSNPRLSEAIVYEFDKEHINVKGESFNSQLTWNKVYRVTETKEWVLIWESSQLAHIVPKRDFRNTDFQLFKEIVKSHKGIKNKLKE